MALTVESWSARSQILSPPSRKRPAEGPPIPYVSSFGHRAANSPSAARAPTQAQASDLASSPVPIMTLRRTVGVTRTPETATLLAKRWIGGRGADGWHEQWECGQVVFAVREKGKDGHLVPFSGAGAESRPPANEYLGGPKPPACPSCVGPLPADSMSIVRFPEDPSDALPMPYDSTRSDDERERCVVATVAQLNAIFPLDAHHLAKLALEALKSMVAVDRDMGKDSPLRKVVKGEYRALRDIVKAIIEAQDVVSKHTGPSAGKAVHPDNVKGLIFAISTIASDRNYADGIPIGFFAHPMRGSDFASAVIKDLRQKDPGKGDPDTDGKYAEIYDISENLRRRRSPVSLTLYDEREIELLGVCIDPARPTHRDDTEIVTVSFGGPTACANYWGSAPRPGKDPRLRPGTRVGFAQTKEGIVPWAGEHPDDADEVFYLGIIVSSEPTSPESDRSIMARNASESGGEDQRWRLGMFQVQQKGVLKLVSDPTRSFSRFVASKDTVVVDVDATSRYRRFTRREPAEVVPIGVPGQRPTTSTRKIGKGSERESKQELPSEKREKGKEKVSGVEPTEQQFGDEGAQGAYTSDEGSEGESEDDA